MALKGVRCVLGYVSTEDHLKCQAQGSPPCGFDPTVLQMIVFPESNKERMDSGVQFSYSTIGACHRQSVLKKDNDYWADVDQDYSRVRGSIVHQGLSHEGPFPGTLGVIRELRLHAPIHTTFGDQVFSGMVDQVVLLRVEDTRATNQLLYPGQGNVKLHVKLTDFKSVGEVGHELTAPYKSHAKQVNLYSWLIRRSLPAWLNGGMLDNILEQGEHLFLNDGVKLPHVDELVVDELSITYLDMKRQRTFTSRGWMSARGKMLGEKGPDKRWHRYDPVQYEELELAPIYELSDTSIESIIKKGIENQIESQTLLAEPLTGDEAKLMCRGCPVRRACIDIGQAEGHNMSEQLAYE